MHLSSPVVAVGVPVVAVNPSAVAVSHPVALLPHFDRATYLMCPPQFYDVRYVINPWMAGNLHRPSRDRAFLQWRALYDRLRQHADVRVLTPHAECPDMCFVAHTAVVQHGVAALSSFAHAERRTEALYLQQWLEDAGFLIWKTPRETAFEGEGDAVFDETSRQLWMAHGPRTCEQSHAHVAAAWHLSAHSLQLIDPRFYHLDTCFAPLTRGRLLWFPEAFDEASRRRVEAAYPANRRLAVTEGEATQFACNVINIDDTLLMGEVAGDLALRLADMGLRVETCCLSEFLQGGGSAKSLALRLSDSTRGSAPARLL